MTSLLALTEDTLTAVLTVQFTSPHHLTQAGEGKILLGILLVKQHVAHRVRWTPWLYYCSYIV